MTFFILYCGLIGYNVEHYPFNLNLSVFNHRHCKCVVSLSKTLYLLQLTQLYDEYQLGNPCEACLCQCCELFEEKIAFKIGRMLCCYS